MQNKLNEILELCIEKSSEEKLYSFYACTLMREVRINTHNMIAGVGCVNSELKRFSFNAGLDQALEYMQNE